MWITHIEQCVDYCLWSTTGHFVKFVDRIRWNTSQMSITELCPHCECTYNPDTRIQRCRVKETQRDTERHRNRNTGAQRHKETEKQRQLDIKTQRNRDIETQRYRDTETLRHWEGVRERKRTGAKKKQSERETQKEKERERNCNPCSRPVNTGVFEIACKSTQKKPK